MSLVCVLDGPVLLLAWGQAVPTVFACDLEAVLMFFLDDLCRFFLWFCHFDPVILVHQAPTLSCL